MLWVQNRSSIRINPCNVCVDHRFAWWSDQPALMLYTEAGNSCIMLFDIFDMAVAYWLYLFISVILACQTDGVVHVHYKDLHGYEVGCETNASLTVRSVLECAIQCTQTETCSYFQQEASSHDSHTCFICNKCVYSAGVFSNSVMMPLDTSQLLTGKPVHLEM